MKNLEKLKQIRTQILEWVKEQGDEFSAIHQNQLNEMAKEAHEYDHEQILEGIVTEYEVIMVQMIAMYNALECFVNPETTPICPKDSTSTVH